MDENVGGSITLRLRRKINLIYQRDRIYDTYRDLPLSRTTQTSYLELACSWP
jgi:hypothetical protein